jgi:hypothetical protein
MKNRDQRVCSAGAENPYNHKSAVIGDRGGMADEAKIGTPWQDDELDAIVTDYFDMLEAELSGRPNVKTSEVFDLKPTSSRRGPAPLLRSYD